MKENIIQKKSYDFALKIIATYKTFFKTREGEGVLLKQLLRCGTSVGANIEEAEGAISKKDFISKVSIAFKEARECLYWLRLLSDSGILGKECSDTLIGDCTELLKIMNSILKTSKVQELSCTS